MKKTKASKPKTSKPESENGLVKSSESENFLPENFLIVGIGASAGGIQALKTFFENVRADSGSAYVVILHLSPDHDSKLAEVLQSVAAIPVAQVTEKVRVEPNHVYVVPPNQHLEMTGEYIVVSPIHTVEERRAPVDIFFRTLAESHGERAVAVILSGTGANGSMGIKRVKEKGGAAFVQNPREAEFSEMPRNSIATDLVDLILNVSEIPAQIAAYRNNPGKIEIPVEPEKQPKEKPKLQPQEQALVNIFTQLRVRTGHDFANYKRATMLRRVERRINVRQLPDITAYVAYLRENPDETHALLKDLLISVTNFFRDKDTFTYLESEILPKLFDGKNSDGQIRVWVAGCATGEEAYSLAMFLAEQSEKAEGKPTVQIFATDIDEAAVAKAREGFYTLNDAADVSPERLKRFFTKENGGYRIRRELREQILFAHHNVIKDPPFSRLDLVTCRNMLIYLNHQAQERVMETFHFSLNAGGYLFLGNSETVDGAGNLYATVSREHHIYQSRQAVPRIGYPVPEASTQTIRLAQRIELEHAEQDGQQTETHPRKRMSFGDLHQQLLEEYTPSVVVSEEHDIVHMSESSLRFLQMTGGEPTQNLLKLIRPKLRLELRTALYQAAQRRKNVEVPNVKINIDGREESVNICVRPVMRQADAARGFILVLFESVKQSNGHSETVYSSDELVARQLEEELIRSKAHLRSSSEQYEVQAEELKASNEELQAMNEELRSSSEELETGKEELQSLNEELGTVNQELKIKIEEISQTSNNLNNLINSTDIGTIFLDRMFRVDLFTPAAAEIFNLIPADIGRPLADIANQLEKTDLLGDAKLVLEKLQTVEREVRSREGRDFTVRVMPYRTKDDKIGGVVLTFYDVTARRLAEKAVRESEEKYRTLFDSIDEGVSTIEVIFDENERAVDFRYLENNSAFVRLTGLPSEATGKRWLELAPALEPFISDRFERIIKTGEPERFEQAISALGDKWFEMYISRVGEHGSRTLVSVYNNITERKRTEANLAFLADISQDLVRLTNIDETMNAIGAKIGAYFQASQCPFGEIDEEQQFVTVTHEWKRADSPSYMGAHRLSDFNTEDFRRTMRAGEIYVMRDAANDPRAHTAQMAAFSIGAFISVPFVREGKWRFNLTLFDTGARDWTDDEVELLSELANRIWTRLERARAEEALRESEERFRAMFEQANVGIVQVSVEGELLAPNPGFCKIIGYSEEEARRLNLRDITHPADYEREVELTSELIAGEIPGYSIEKRYVCKDGGIVWGQMTATLIRRRGSEPLYALAIVEDISERKQAEKNLRESEERLRLATEAAEMYSWEFDAGSKTYKFSENAARVLGIDADDLPVTIEDTFRLVHPDDLKTMRATIKDALKTGEGYTLDLRSVKKSGEIVWLSVQTTVVKDERGRAWRILGITQDITTRRRAEKALVESEERLRLLIESASDYAIFTTTRDGLIDSWNAGAEKVFGWSELEVLGVSAEIIFTPEDREKGEPAKEIKTALKKGRAPDERFHIRKDESRFYSSGVMTTIKDVNDKVQGLVKIARDMTEIINAERALREKEMLQKLVGAQEDERKRIARDLHDELGQQLTALRLKLDAARKLCDDDELCGKIDEIELIAKSIDNGVDFLAWELRPAALDDLGLVAALENYVKQWSHHSGATAELLASNLKKTRFEPEVETNLYRIVQEALNNTHKHAKAKSIEVVLEKRDGLIVMLIEDNGKGFNPKDKKNLLKGMGLIGMKERAQLIGGTLEIESAPGKGTTVFVRVPAESVKRRRSDDE